MIRKASTAAILAATIAAPAFAESEAFEFEFAYSPDAVQTEAGAAEAYERLEREIAEHCDTNWRASKSVKLRVEERACQERTMRDAMAKIAQPSLAAIDAAQSEG